MTKMTWVWKNKPATIEQVLSEVPKGWHSLVKNLIDELFTLGWDGDLEQVKEKFGGLRFYIPRYSDAIDKAIIKAENLSITTCQVCGEPGHERNTGWVRTLCDEHAKQYSSF